ncbi:MAG: Ig-like domain-containing protein [Patescibacteria group bacterium]|jgi:hypothetical protein
MRRRKSNHRPHGFLVIALAVILLTAGVWRFVELTKADITETVTVTATVLGCGDGIIQIGEDCDGANMNSHTCVTEGYAGGSISCSASCTLNTASCSAIASTGGGSTPLVVVSSTNEIFTGLAYPSSPITLLKDGQKFGTTTADAVGEFLIKANNFINGTYTFGFQATDSAGNFSALTTVTLTANGGTVTTPNIFISPSINPVSTVILPGDQLKITGQSTPRAAITINLSSPAGTLLATQQVTANSNGAYAATFNTTALRLAGAYSVTAQASLNNLTSTLSLPMSFTLGAAPIIYMPGDYNEDQRVNLVDFSIGLYWYKEQLSDAFKILEIRHGNGDGRLNLVDISIIAYWWTG